MPNVTARDFFRISRDPPESSAPNERETLSGRSQLVNEPRNAHMARVLAVTSADRLVTPPVPTFQSTGVEMVAFGGYVYFAANDGVLGNDGGYEAAFTNVVPAGAGAGSLRSTLSLTPTQPPRSSPSGWAP